jgi:hypothetical protein
MESFKQWLAEQEASNSEIQQQARLTNKSTAKALQSVVGGDSNTGDMTKALEDPTIATNIARKATSISGNKVKPGDALASATKLTNPVDNPATSMMKKKMKKKMGKK